MDKQALQAAVNDIPHWFHSINLPHNVVTQGDKNAQLLEAELQTLQLPELKGKSVLDIGAWDGFYTFAAERRGAASVLSLDHFVWSIDRVRSTELTNDWHATGTEFTPFEQTDAWRPDTLPGKRGYNLAHQALGSRAKSHVADFMSVDVADIDGPFDVVFFLGVLYHIKRPMAALEKVAALTGEVAVIETEGVEFAGRADTALCEFFERDELAGDFTNWWATNLTALVSMCRAAGFSRVDVIQGPPKQEVIPPIYSTKDKLWRTGNYFLREFGLRPQPEESTPEPTRYRAVVHAWK